MGRKKKKKKGEAPAPESAGRRWGAAAALMLLFVVLAASGLWRKSATFDEMAHLVGGAAYWTHNDYRVHTQNGVLTQRWMTLPLLFGGHRLPPPDHPAWRHPVEWELGRLFFYESGNDADAMVRKCRVMAILMSVLLAAAVFLWSRRLFGPAGGLVSLAVCSLSPNILAHGRLAASDATAALFFLLAAWGWWSVIHSLSWRTLLWSSAAAGALFASKMSAPLILPAAAILAGIRLAGRRPWEVSIPALRPGGGRFPWAAAGAVVLAHGLAVFVLLWALYGFRFSGFNEDRVPGGRYLYSWEEVLKGAGSAGPLVDFARRRKLLPEAYLFGFATVLTESRERPAFLNGEWSATGWWYYFPYLFLIKTPTGLLALLLLALLGALGGRSSGRAPPSGSVPGAWAGFYDTAPLWVLLCVYSAVLLTSTINIGLRHMLPVYPPLFVLAGGAAWALASARWRWAAGAALAASAIGCLSSWPDYLSYFNLPSGGARSGYRKVVDSSLDWGQDLPALKAWLAGEGLDRPGPVYLSYFGTASPARHGIDALRLPSFLDMDGREHLGPLTPGLYCVSATMLQSVYLPPGGPWTAEHERTYRALRKAVSGAKGPGAARLLRAHSRYRFARLCAFLRRREPDGRAGGSILIYRLGAAELKTCLEGAPPA